MLAGGIVLLLFLSTLDLDPMYYDPYHEESQ